MEPFIRAARVEDIARVVELLATRMNRRIARARWHRMLTHSWLAGRPDIGRLVEKDGAILGFLGMIYAERPIGGRVERIVNLTSWYLDKTLRGRGLGEGLLKAAVAGSDCTFTAITVSRNSLPIFRNHGFRNLDDSHLVWRRSGAGATGLAVARDPAAVRAALDNTQCRMLDDHAGLAVRPVLAEHAGRRCLLLFSVSRKGADVETWDVLHASDRAFLAEHGQGLAEALLPAGAAVLAADPRLVDGHAPGATPYPLPIPRLYRSRRLAPEQVDFLYNELQLLDLKLD